MRKTDVWFLIGAAALILVLSIAEGVGWLSIVRGSIYSPPRLQLPSSPSQPSGTVLPSVVGIIAFALLVMVLGYEMIGIVIALVTVITVFQMAGGASQYVSYAFAIGLALASFSRRAHPLLHMPRSVAILLAFVAAVALAASDMSFFAYAIIYIAQVLGQLLLGVMSPLGQLTAVFAVVGLMLAVTYLARIVAMARGLSAVVLAIAASLVGYDAAVYVLDTLFQAVGGGIGAVVVVVAGMVAIIDFFTSLERLKIESLIWVAPLGALIYAAFGISLAPLLAALAGILAVGAAFTLRDELAVLSIMLSLAAIII